MAVSESEKMLEANLTEQVKELSVANPGEATAVESTTATTTTTSEGDPVPSVAERSLLQKVIRKGLVENKNDLEIQRKDPKSPLYSVKSFEALNLKPQLLKGVYGMGFNAPSKIQETALPTLLADPPLNMIAQSQSGTGKTAAFVLAMLSRVDTSHQYPQVDAHIQNGARSEIRNILNQVTQPQ
jgi:ATP-dependent RNA helicase DDX19/DBP5